MSTPESRQRKKSARVGVVVLIITAAMLWLTFKAQTGWPFAPTTEVKAEFANVHSLKVNDDVRQNSKRVGRISDVEYKDGKAVVTMELSGHRDVYANARAVIWDQSALATKFVDLYPGTPEAGELGEGTITARSTTSSHDLYQLLDVFDEKTRDATQVYLRNVGGGLAAHSSDLKDLLGVSPDLLSDVSAVSEALASDEADLPGLMRSSRRLSERFEGHTGEISSLIEQTGESLRALDTDGGRPLGETLQSAPQALRSLRGSLEVLDPTLDDTDAAMKALRPGARDLGRSVPDLQSVLVQGERAARKMPPVFEQAEPVVEDLTTTVDEAQPLGPRITKAFVSAQPFLKVLAPYSPEIATWAVRGRSFLSQGPAPGIRFARLVVVPSADTVTGGLIGSGTYKQNSYPAPGEAMTDRNTEGLPAGLPIGGTQ